MTRMMRKKSMRLTQTQFKSEEDDDSDGFFVPDGYLFEDEVNSTEKKLFDGVLFSSVHKNPVLLF